MKKEITKIVCQIEDDLKHLNEMPGLAKRKK